MNHFPEPGTPAFPSALKDLRESKGLSRAQLSAISKIRADAIRRYEQVDRVDHAVPSVDSWNKLKLALDIQANVFLTFDQLTLAVFGNSITNLVDWQPIKHNVSTQWQNINS